MSAGSAPASMTSLYNQKSGTEIAISVNEAITRESASILTNRLAHSLRPLVLQNRHRADHDPFKDSDCSYHVANVIFCNRGQGYSEHLSGA